MRKVTFSLERKTNQKIQDGPANKQNNRNWKT